LCDLSARRGALEALAERLRRELGFQGPIQVVEMDRTPGEVYEASLILSATSVANVLDEDRLRPGTLLVDDSAAHCLDPRQAIRRLQEHRDVLFTEAGAIRSHRPIEEISDLTVATGWGPQDPGGAEAPAPGRERDHGVRVLQHSHLPVPGDPADGGGAEAGGPGGHPPQAPGAPVSRAHTCYFEDHVLDGELVRLFRERHGRPG